jgi:hypothetical protein
MTDDMVSLHSHLGVGTVVSLWENGIANISVYLHYHHLHKTKQKVKQKFKTTQRPKAVPKTLQYLGSPRPTHSTVP